MYAWESTAGIRTIETYKRYNWIAGWKLYARLHVHIVAISSQLLCSGSALNAYKTFYLEHSENTIDHLLL